MSDFPALKPISIDDRSLFLQFLNDFQPQLSELTFTNLFMWRHHYHFKWAIMNDTLLLFAGDPSDFYLFQPIGKRPLRPTILTVLKWLRKEWNQSCPHLERVDKETADEFENDPVVEVEALPDHFDYVYDSNKLVTLAGRNYHSKRNHISRFKNAYEYTYKELTSDYIDRCLELSDRWCKTYHCKGNKGLCAEWKAIREAMTHFKELQFKGGLIIINDVVEAFTLGEMLNNSTAVIHIEKANIEIHGIYSAINQFFCDSTWKNASFINREQDLGETGLRSAKSSYFPQKMIEKFRITLR